jgi:hypothetical protein
MPDPSHQWRTDSEQGKLCRVVPSCRSSHDLQLVQTTIATDQCLFTSFSFVFETLSSQAFDAGYLWISGMLDSFWNILKPILSGSYLAHTQGKKHQINLARRAAREKQARQGATHKLRQNPVMEHFCIRSLDISWKFWVISSHFLIVSCHSLSFVPQFFGPGCNDSASAANIFRRAEVKRHARPHSQYCQQLYINM